MSFPVVPLPFVPAVGIGLLGGGLVGLLHFAGLRRTVDLLAAGRTGPALLLQLLRVVVSALLLAALFAFGFAALVAGLGAFLVARHALLRERRTTDAPPPRESEA